MFICSMLTSKTVLKNPSKYLTYYHMTFWVVPILIFSDDILGCTYSQESGNILFDDITTSMVLFIVTLLFCLV